MFARFRSSWRALRRRAEWERDLEAELRSHVEHRAADLERQGMAGGQAARQARLELGAGEAFKEKCRAANGLRWPDELRQDLRYAGRMMRRSPGFTAVAALSLALGIGANTAVFSVLNALILKPLAVSSPDTVFFVQTSDQKSGAFRSQSYPNYRDLRDRNTTLAGLAAYRIVPMGLDMGGGAQRVSGNLVTGNYFDLLGIRPARGRFFHAADDQKPDASPFAVLSYACWQGRFAADPRIVGSTIRINALPYTVLGVAPSGFFGTELLYRPEIWVPMMMQAQIEPRPWLEERDDFNIWLIGRLERGVAPRQAEENLNAIAAALAREFPATNEGLRLRLTRPGLVGDLLRAPAKAFTGGVMALAGLVLLAACVNLASLLGARAADRDRELAIRISIGAGRARVLRQLLVESVLLALLGGAAGCALALALLRLLAHWRAPLDVPVHIEVHADLAVFLFALAVSIATGLLFGLAPARQAWASDPNRALKGMPSPGAAGRRWALRDLLLVAQVTVCCLLVTACFVAVRGLARSLATPLGFDARGVAVAGFDLGLARFKPEDGMLFQRRALDAVARLPGVVAAAYARSLPLGLNQSTTIVYPEGTAVFRAANGKEAAYFNVSPDYFRAMGTRLLAGREFTWHDDPKAPRVAIVNETFARQVIWRAGRDPRWGRAGAARDAVGRRFNVETAKPPVEVVEVVGVVEDGKYFSLSEDARPVIFYPAPQAYSAATVLIVRSSRTAAEVAGEMRATINALDSRLPLYGVGTVTQTLGLAFLPSQAAAFALGAFGLLAIMLAVTGTYGLAAYAVSRRVREIGIRVAMGARPWQLLRFVLGRTALLLAAGSALGLVLGTAAGRLLGSIVYHASPSDPLIWPAVAVTMAVIGLGAACAPARRALAIDPVRALRHE